MQNVIRTTIPTLLGEVLGLYRWVNVVPVLWKSQQPTTRGLARSGQQQNQLPLPTQLKRLSSLCHMLDQRIVFALQHQQHSPVISSTSFCHYSCVHIYHANDPFQCKRCNKFLGFEVNSGLTGKIVNGELLQA